MPDDDVAPHLRLPASSVTWISGRAAVNKSALLIEGTYLTLLAAGHVSPVEGSAKLVWLRGVFETYGRRAVDKG